MNASLSIAVIASLALVLPTSEAFISSPTKIYSLQLQPEKRTYSKRLQVRLRPSRLEISRGKSLYNNINGSNNNNKQKYIRIQRKTLRGQRRQFELQTAVTTLTKSLPNNSQISIDLHAQIHFGQRDYFSYYNNPQAFTSRYDGVHYELILSKDLLRTNPMDGTKYLLPTPDGLSPILPSPNDQNTASQYGLTCQLDVMDYTQPNWIHSDYTREEFQSLQQQSQSTSTHRNDNANANANANATPAWALASTASTTTLPGMEFIAALFRPSTPMTPPTSPFSRRLFSNLFLPGDMFTALIRILLWTFTPSPEVSVMLLDWSSISPKPVVGGMSQLVLPVFQCLVTGNLLEARRLLFAQLLVSGQNGAGGREEMIVKKRNGRALEVLNAHLERMQVEEEHQKKKVDQRNRLAVVYGAMHCQDLQSRLQNMGFVVEKVDWRCAWSVDVPSFGTGRVRTGVRSNSQGTATSASSSADLAAFASTSDPSAIAFGLVTVPLYLLVGGLDWLGTVQDLSLYLDAGQWADTLVIGLFYLMRHVALYLGIAKFVVDWDGEVNLFDGGGGGGGGGRTRT